MSKKIGKSFQKICKNLQNFLKLVKLLKTSKQFISNFTERLEIIRNLQNTGMKLLEKIFQNFDKFLK